MTQQLHSGDADQIHSHLGLLGTCTQMILAHVHNGRRELEET